MRNYRLRLTVVLITLVLGHVVFAAAERSSENDPLLEAALAKFPAADADKDGVLTLKEALDYKKRMQPAAPKADPLPPTHEDVAYGDDPRQRLDLWLAKSETPTPLVICIHGGGFMGGDKGTYRSRRDAIQALLQAGISVASINYRLTDGGRNPYPIPMLDGARAVQFLRFSAERYNLRADRFAATGGSAGGCMSLWLGFHDDLADPNSEDPVLRQSTRLLALVPENAQPSLELDTLSQWFGGTALTEHPAFRPLFGIAADVAKPELTGELKALVHQASPISYLTADDPPCFLSYGGGDTPVTDATPPNEWVHHPRLGINLKSRMDELGVYCDLAYRNGPKTGYSDALAFLLDKLKAKN